MPTFLKTASSFRQGARTLAGEYFTSTDIFVRERDAIHGRKNRGSERRGGAEGYMLDLAWCMVQAGLAREESRGAHSRPGDFPDRDDERFLKHSVSRWVDGGPELASEEVRMTRWQPEVRSY